MAQTTTNYSFNIAEGTDVVNLLTQCYPNFTSLDTILKGIDDSAITVASETKSGTVHQLVRSNANRNFIRFSATSNFTLGDTFTVDGTPVTATTIAGTSLQTGDFVINSNVVCILNGALLTVLVGGSVPTPDAEDIPYDNSVSGLTATDVQAAIDEVLGDIPANAAALSYDNTVSGLTATDVQNAIDEVVGMIPGSNVRTLATASGSDTYGNKIATLKAAFDALTADEKLRTFIEDSRGFVLPCGATYGSFVVIWLSANTISSMGYRFDLGTFYEGSNTTVTDHTTQTSTATLTLKIKD